jgi:Tol biopolymer transport system component
VTGRTGLLAAIAAMLAIAPHADAQFYFGQNQVQYDSFDWKVIETDHFLVHYYPGEETAARDAARMAERAYGRLARILAHEFREKKPIVLFASRSDFGQNNVTGDLGEFTGGVTEALRHRILMPFTGDYGSFEQVLTHEMVHEFQYDIYSRGKAGAGLQTLQQQAMPYWFAEGMAEYLSLGPGDVYANTVMRDAALNGRLPSMEALTMRPDLYNPYDIGQALWEYVGDRWGDEVIGAILQAAPNVGVERAFRRELGKSLEDLGDEWKEAMQVKHLPQIADLERARKYAQPLLSERRSGGAIFLAPALSPNGEQIVFLSNGSFLRGQIFIDLWLADARTGKRLKRLVKSTTNPEFEELRLLYSQSSFSPDGRTLAFTAQRKGKDVLYLLDVRRRKVIRRIDTHLEGMTGPSWSPDGKRIVFSGHFGGISDLYIVDSDGSHLTQLTKDRHGDLQPQWSPDGKRIAFASDRGPETDFGVLRYSPWKISTYDLASGQIEVVPGQDAHNINPMWSPDSRSIAYVSTRTGIQNLFLYEIDSNEHYQLTNVVGGITAATNYSPVISWARQSDKLALTYYENGDYTIWSIDNPRSLKRSPYRAPTPRTPLMAETPRVDTTLVSSIATLPDSGSSFPSVDTTAARVHFSYYRSTAGIRPSQAAPAAAELASRGGPVSVAALLDSAAMALPDAGRFKIYDYKVRFSPDYVARPSIGYEQYNFGRGFFGGTQIVLSDMLGGHRLAFSAEVNGNISEARLYSAYTNLSRRMQYSVGAYQSPYYFPEVGTLIDQGGGIWEELYPITRIIERQVFGIGIYPLNRFTRMEFGARLSNVDRSSMFISRLVNLNTGQTTPYQVRAEIHQPSINYVQPYSAFVSDNVLWGYTGPIMGRRYRIQVEPILGTYQWIDYLLDWRRYDPILFNFLTLSTRVLASVSDGRDADTLRKYIAYPELLRGYDREEYALGQTQLCGTSRPDEELQLGKYYRCSPLVGSRIAVMNAEVRFPLFRRVDIGLLPLSLPPIEGLVFYDVGVSWFDGQSLHWSRPAGFDPGFQRHVLRSWGFGIRANLFNFALLRWDYSKPLDDLRRDGYWRFSLGPSF